MSWIEERKHKWRAVILVGMIVAFFGPWSFDSISVPSEYACEFRLHDNICGVPLLGLQVYSWFFGGIFTELFKGLSNSKENVRLILVSLILFCPLIPLFNTALLVLSERYHPPKGFTITAWCLAIGAGVFFGIRFFSNQFWALWGLWVFMGLSISALILEILFLAKERKRNEDI